MPSEALPPDLLLQAAALTGPVLRDKLEAQKEELKRQNEAKDAEIKTLDQEIAAKDREIEAIDMVINLLRRDIQALRQRRSNQADGEEVSG